MKDVAFALASLSQSGEARWYNPLVLFFVACLALAHATDWACDRFGVPRE